MSNLTDSYLVLSFRRTNMVAYTLEQRWEILLHYDFRKEIIFSDEAYCDLGGHVNKQNYRIWGTENQHAYIEKPMHPKRVTVWWGFWSRVMLNEFLFTKI